LPIQFCSASASGNCRAAGDCHPDRSSSAFSCVRFSDIKIGLFSGGLRVPLLQNHIALITGASRGIGKAIALALAEAGAEVAINYRRQNQAAESVALNIRKLGRRCVTVQADVSESGEVDRLFSEVEKNLGAVDILVNNAGIASALSPAQVTEAHWHETIRVNLTSVFLVTQRALPAMRAKKWGRIINLSSVAAQYGGIVGQQYSASKAGILGLTRSYASFLAKEGITVNAIAPALIETDMIANLPALTPDRLPVGHFGSVDEVARVAVMLAENSFITGQTINPNGGLYFT
jgi:3-oxoacyl-[acyl-carrier protein] reductase